jgi:uncharacterized protein YjiS (DUF1127 family)
MYAYETRGSVPFGAVTIHHAISAVERVLVRLLAWRNARATEAELRKLSDQQLADVGLLRGEIAGVAARLARG